MTCEKISIQEHTLILFYFVDSLDLNIYEFYLLKCYITLFKIISKLPIIKIETILIRRNKTLDSKIIIYMIHGLFALLKRYIYI